MPSLKLLSKHPARVGERFSHGSVTALQKVRCQKHPAHRGFARSSRFLLDAAHEARPYTLNAWQLTLCRAVTMPWLKRLPKRPARPAICLTSAGSRPLRVRPSNFSSVVNTTLLHLIAVLFGDDTMAGVCEGVGGLEQHPCMSMCMAQSVRPRVLGS